MSFTLQDLDNICAKLAEPTPPRPLGIHPILILCMNKEQILEISQGCASGKFYIEPCGAETIYKLRKHLKDLNLEDLLN